MAEDLMNTVLDLFTTITEIKAKWRPLKKSDYMYDYVDGLIQFGTGTNKIEMVAEQINNVQNPNIAHFINLININKSLVVIANTIQPRFKQELQNLRINYIDAAGNIYFKHDPIFIWIEGRKHPENNPYIKNKPFSKAGLKVIFQLLLNDDYINETVREIAKAAEVSLDSAHKTITGLKKLEYLVPINNNTLGWNNKKELFNKWISEYDTRLKPSLLVGRFRFFDEKEFLNWKKTSFKSTLTKWGGEPAGELLTDFLKPEKLTIYTKEPRLDWIRNYRLIQDPKGYIEIYDRFWKTDIDDKVTAPPLLIYADLVNTGNRRNIETAQKIYEQQLQGKF